MYINPNGILDNIPDDPWIIGLAGQIQSIMLGLGNVIEDTNGLSSFPCRYFLMRIVVSSDECICDLLVNDVLRYRGKKGRMMLGKIYEYVVGMYFFC